MKTFISVECSRCRKEINEKEDGYCSECMDNKDEELSLQDDQIVDFEETIKSLKDEIAELENIIEGLKKELEHGNTYTRE